ncbi:MAG: glycosyltransferase [Chloroflexi bacterium]|nr:MAG: glycosyltransferase [Chloroflexota bacterium]
MMEKTITILSIHSCFGQKIGIGNAGGLNIYVDNLITFLLSKNHKIIFITSSHEYCELEDKENLKIIHINNLDKSSEEIESIKNETDLLISNYWTSGTFAKVFFDSSDIPKINISHTLEFLKKIHNEQYKIDNKRFEEEKKFYDFFDYVLAFSDLEKEVLLSEYGYKTSQIIESTPGYKDDVFYSIPKVKARNYLDLYQNEKLILFVGRLDYLKGLDIAIEVINLSNKNNKNYKLLIVGGDVGSKEQKKLIKELDKMKISDSVVWLGSLSQKELNYCYNAADIVMIPSRSETFGLVCLEASATQTPVLASQVGRMKDILEDGKYGILAEDITPENFADKLEIFFQKEEIYKVNNLDRIKNLEWNSVLEKTFNKFI